MFTYCPSCINDVSPMGGQLYVSIDEWHTTMDTDGRCFPESPVRLQGEMGSGSCICICDGRDMMLIEGRKAS